MKCKTMLCMLTVAAAAPAWSFKLVLERPPLRPIVFCTHLTADPQVIPLCDLCPGYSVSKKGDSVLVRCSGEALDKPFFSIPHCANPAVVQRTADVALIKCQ